VHRRISERLKKLIFDFYKFFPAEPVLKCVGMNKTAPIQTESIYQFYQRTNQPLPPEPGPENTGIGHFNVKQTDVSTRKTPYNRRDYFKICLGSGQGRGVLLYNGHEIALDQPCLIFTNPSVPASIENPCRNSRFYCVFDNRFISDHIRPDIQYACALFNPSLYPVIKLSEEERERLGVYFLELQSLQESDYPFKWDMIRNLLLLLIHEGIRLQQSKPVVVNPLLRDRVVNGFFSLLNQQFPVDSPENPLKLLSPSVFAELLHVHVNHLNSMIKKHTGKSTRTIIHERVIFEAKNLLRNTDWNISEIAYALGFEYPSHFNKYFKQFSSLTPMEFRANRIPAVPGNL
jgi:AraC family transcriptional activator of pobA